MKTVFRKSLLLRVVVIAGVLASVLHAQDQPQAASPEIKRLQDAFVGEWKTQETMERSDFFPSGGGRTGHARFRLGSGGYTLVGEGSSDGSAGKLDYMIVVNDTRRARVWGPRLVRCRCAMLPTEVSPNMSRVVGFFVLGLLVCLSATRATADRLIYAVSYQETTASLRAHPRPNIFSATTNQKLAMLRRYRKTEIHAISPSDSKSSLLFSDEGMNFEIEPFNDAGNPLLPGKAFLPGVEREWRTTPTPGAYESPQAIYELSLDGSNRFRRLFETLPNSTYLSVNLSGSRAALRAYVKDKYTFYVYDTRNWNVLHSWDIQKLLHDHCPDCQPLSDGWVADGTLFISLDLVDEDSIEQEDKDVPGIFFVGEDGTEVGGVSREMGKLHLPGYVRDDSILPELIGQLPDGSYLFRDYARKAGPLPKPPLRMSSFLVIAKPGSTMQKQIPLQVSVGVHQFQLSPSGRFVAFVEDRQVPNYKTERHLWTKDLETGEEKELLLMPETRPQPTDPIPVFRVLGWEGEK